MDPIYDLERRVASWKQELQQIVYALNYHQTQCQALQNRQQQLQDKLDQANSVVEQLLVHVTPHMLETISQLTASPTSSPSPITQPAAAAAAAKFTAEDLDGLQIAKNQSPGAPNPFHPDGPELPTAASLYQMCVTSNTCVHGGFLDFQDEARWGNLPQTLLHDPIMRKLTTLINPKELKKWYVFVFGNRNYVLVSPNGEYIARKYMWPSAVARLAARNS